MISPASTDDDLTLRGWKFYHRVIAPAGAQAEVIAAYIDRRIKPRGVYIVGDNQTYSNGLADTVANDLKRVGVKVVGRGTASVGDAAGVQTQVAAIGASGADLVFYAGLHDGAGPMLRALRASGNKARYMGASGLDTPQFIGLAGGDAGGAIYVTGLGPLQNYTNGPSFIENYRKAFGHVPAGRSAFTYDAMNVMLDALAEAARAARKTPTRAQVIGAVKRVNLPASRSVTGPIAFSPTGERRSAPMFVVEIDAQTLQPVMILVQQHRATK